VIFSFFVKKNRAGLSDRFSSTKERILSQNKLIAKLSKFNYLNDISVTGLLTVVMFC
jgi:hypothetical protein